MHAHVEQVRLLQLRQHLQVYLMRREGVGMLTQPQVLQPAAHLT